MARILVQDASWLGVETPATPTNFATVQIYRPPVGEEAKFAARLVDRVRRFAPNRPPFDKVVERQSFAAWDSFAKPKLGWRRAARIDMEHHVRLWTLDPRGGEAALHALMARLHAQRLDRERPLWEYHVIDGLADGRFAVYAKFHHALVDGKLALDLLDASASPEERGRPPAWHSPDAVPRRARLFPLFRSYSDLAQLVGAAKAAPDVLAAMRELDSGKAKPRRDGLVGMFSAPPSPFNGEISAQRGYATTTLSLARCKAIAAQAGSTVNDVFVALVGGAIRHELERTGALPAVPLVASVPYAVERAKDAGNAIIGFQASLATDIADPVARLQAVSLSAAAGKAHLRAMSPEALKLYVAAMMAMMPLQKHRLPITLPKPKRMLANVVVSNIPGPRGTVWLDGAELERIFPISVLSGGIALNVTLVSYADQVGFGITHCPDVVADVQWLADGLEGQLNALEQAFGLVATRRRRRRAAEGAGGPTAVVAACPGTMPPRRAQAQKRKVAPKPKVNGSPM